MTRNNWEKEFEKIWAEYPKNVHENTLGLDAIIKSFIKSQKEQSYQNGWEKGSIEGEKHYEIHCEEEKEQTYKKGVKEGIEKGRMNLARQILKWRTEKKNQIKAEIVKETLDKIEKEILKATETTTYNVKFIFSNFN